MTDEIYSSAIRRHVACYKYTNVTEERTVSCWSSKGVCSSETSANFNHTAWNLVIVMAVMSSTVMMNADRWLLWPCWLCWPCLFPVNSNTGALWTQWQWARGLQRQGLFIVG